MNLAIIIAVSNYNSPLSLLPSCKHDAVAVSALVSTESKYDSQLILSESEPSAVVKQRLIEFINENKNVEIDEVFFYYSGHGDFDGKEFYYLLSDYDPKRKRQTSLENSELDELLRGIQPKLTIKVIDSCHSGVHYIKNDDSFRQYLKGTEDHFKKCYFLCSSQANQSSFADNSLSFFTRAFVEAVVNHPTEIVRYKDIIDHISDAFSMDSQQTPFFVVQADFTEIFCTLSDSLRRRVEESLKALPYQDMSLVQAAGLGSILERVKRDASRYCSEEEAMDVLRKLRGDFDVSRIPNEAEELFNVRTDLFDDYSEVPKQASIGSWLEKNQGTYFAEPYYTSVAVETQEPDLYTTYALLGRSPQYRTATRYINRVAGFKPTVDMPYKQLRMTATPQFPNLQKTVLIVIPILSRTKGIFFHVVGKFREIGWGKEVLEANTDWKVAEVGLKDAQALEEWLTQIINQFWDYTLEPIRKSFGSDESPRQEN